MGLIAQCRRYPAFLPARDAIDLTGFMPVSGVLGV
jgi:hypothetical protein